MESITKIIAPMGNNLFVTTSLLVLLDKLFKNDKHIGGGTLFHVLQDILMPLGINNFLSTLGLISLTKMKGGDECGSECNRMIGGKKTKRLNNMECNCDRMKGGLYGDDNCGIGNNALEVVGDKALNYSTNLQQFGCKIPEWGYNLFVDGANNQYKCI